MIGIIKRQEQIIGSLEKATEKIVYKSDHKIMSLNYAYNFIKTTSKITPIVYESEES